MLLNHVYRQVWSYVFCTMSGWNSTDVLICFVVAPCVMIVLSPLYIHLMHKNYYKIVKQLKSFKIIIVAPTCFGLHKSSSGSSQPVLRFSFNTLTCSCAFTNHPVYSGSHSVLVRLPITRYISDHIQFSCVYQSPGI